MPELPEVETIRRQLAKEIINKKIKEFGAKVVDIRRRAKLLIIDLDDGSSLVFHLKLTGQLIFRPAADIAKPGVADRTEGQGDRSIPPKGREAMSGMGRYTRKIFIFDDGSKLLFNDARKFGWWKRVKDTQKIEKEFGPEPIAAEFTLPVFKKLLNKRPRSKIKPLLMDQKFIAGIGNLYSDEILFYARVRPKRRVGEIAEKEMEEIFKGIKMILKKAIEYRGTGGSYRDIYGRIGNYIKFLAVYHRARCPRCRTSIKTIKIGGRSGHYCPKCQK